MKRAQAQMQFYEDLSKGDLRNTLQTVIVKQNQLLKLLQQEPTTKQFGTR